MIPHGGKHDFISIGINDGYPKLYSSCLVHWLSGSNIHLSQNPESLQIMNYIYTETTNDIVITVVSDYVPERSAPEYKQFFFKYTIRITNNSLESIKMNLRHFKIFDGSGRKYEVQGLGILGEQPTIESGAFYEYMSFCPLHSPSGNIRGKYQATSESGEIMWLTIPLTFFRIYNGPAISNS